MLYINEVRRLNLLFFSSLFLHIFELDAFKLSLHDDRTSDTQYIHLNTDSIEKSS